MTCLPTLPSCVSQQALVALWPLSPSEVTVASEKQPTVCQRVVPGSSEAGQQWGSGSSLLGLDSLTYKVRESDNFKLSPSHYFSIDLATHLLSQQASS